MLLLHISFGTLCWQVLSPPQRRFAFSNFLRLFVLLCEHRFQVAAESCWWLLFRIWRSLMQFSYMRSATSSAPGRNMICCSAPTSKFSTSFSEFPPMHRHFRAFIVNVVFCRAIAQWLKQLLAVLLALWHQLLRMPSCSKSEVYFFDFF